MSHAQDSDVNSCSDQRKYEMDLHLEPAVIAVVDLGDVLRPLAVEFVRLENMVRFDIGEQRIPDMRTPTAVARPS